MAVVPSASKETFRKSFWYIRTGLLILISIFIDFMQVTGSSLTNSSKHVVHIFGCMAITNLIDR
jgi:preprotein translocase subunit SecY